jgi:hypothetical protein
MQYNFTELLSRYQNTFNFDNNNNNNSNRPHHHHHRLFHLYYLHNTKWKNGILWNKLESTRVTSWYELLLLNWMKFSYYNGNSHPARFNRWNKIKWTFRDNGQEGEISFLLKIERGVEMMMLQEVLSENKLFKSVFLNLFWLKSQKVIFGLNVSWLCRVGKVGWGKLLEI